MAAPQTGMPYWVRRRIFQREVGVADFSGGLNLRDAPSELANNESPDLWNVTLDERGGVTKRLGYVKLNGAAFTTSSPPQQLYVWRLNGTVFTQCGPDIFKGTGTSTVHTFTTSARVGFAEFDTRILVLHPVDGLFWSPDGTTWMHVVGAPPGSVLEPWQNRLLSLGDPSNVTRLSASAIGDPLNWSTITGDRSGNDAGVTNGNTQVTSATANFLSSDVSKKITLAGVDYHIATVTNGTTIQLDKNYTGTTATGVAWAIQGTGWFNEIREKDSKPLVAMRSASGLDITGKPGILVFKQDSTYRVNDSNTGSYQTLDVTVGAASSIAVTDLYNETFVIHTSGVYQTNGVSPLTLASAKLQPLFTATEIAFDQANLFCAGVKFDRVHFSLPRAGSTHNDLHLEYHPAQGWFAAASDAASCYATYRQQTEKLYGGAPAVNGQTYEFRAATGSDDGAAISCWFQTKWLAPGGGIETRFRRLRVFGRGNYKVFAKLNFDQGAGQECDVSLAGAAALWGQFNWGDGTQWATSVYEDHQDFWSLGVGTHIAFKLTETSTLTASQRAPFGIGAGQTAGPIALYGLDLMFIPVSL
jgi:hypothetical protein